MIQRVALVSPYDFARNGGVTEHVQHLAKQLRQRNIDVTILAPSSRPDLAEPGLVSLGTVMPIPINGSVARTTLSPAVADEVSALLARNRFDVIHLHEPLAPMLPLSVLNASPSPNVGTFHASGERSLGYAASRKLLNWLAQRLTVRVAVSPAAARFAQQYFAGEYTIIPNGVDTERFNTRVEPLPGLRTEQPTILFVGRFEEPRKGFNMLLPAFAEVQRYIPQARMLVVGRGDPGPFEEQARALGVRNLVFEGVVSAEDLPRYYRSVDVLCAPSTGQESFGIILAEAMSSGCPVVASDIEGYAQVVTHRREGLLVPPCQPDALAVGLLQILGDQLLRQQLASAGPETAAQYAWTDVSQRVIDVYERACFLAHRAKARSFSTSSGVLLPKAPTLLATPGTALLASPVVQLAPPTTLYNETQGATPMLTEPIEARVRAITQRVVGHVLGRSGITPNMLTMLGLVLTVGVTATLATGHLVWGGVLVLLTSAFDMLDGALARSKEQQSTFGAFFDSTIDRYSEALIFLGLLLHYQQVPASHFELTFVYLAIVGSLMVSYTRARAEALGIECKVGILARPERVILLSLGLIIGWLHVTLAILALFTNFTAAQRIYHVWFQTEGKQRRAAKVTQRRSWFASRDQSPS
ncbi:MAG TPA: glycosyltransferase [Herpetosiphonaceae bacterium]